MKKLLISMAAVLVFYFIFSIWNTEGQEDIGVTITSETGPEIQSKIKLNEELSKKTYVQEENETHVQQIVIETPDQYYEDELVSKRLINEDGKLNYKKIDSVVNSNEQFRQLMEEVQNPVETIDLEVYQNTYESLAKIIELSKYSYKHGCSNNVCAIEVSAVQQKEEANALADLIRDYALTGSYTYELFRHENGQEDIRIIFSSLDM